MRSVDPSYVSAGDRHAVRQRRSRGTSASRTTATSIRGRDGASTAQVGDFFQTHVGQDLIFDPTEGRNTLVERLDAHRLVRARRARSAASSTSPPTRRRQGRLRHHRPVLALLRSARPVRAGPRPARRRGALHRPALAARPPSRSARPSATASATSAAARCPTGSVSDIIFVSDASVGLGWTIWNVRLSGQNLFDAKYRLGEYNYASNFQKLLPEPTLAPERSFTAGAPRTVMLTLSATLGGGVMRRALFLRWSSSRCSARCAVVQRHDGRPAPHASPPTRRGVAGRVGSRSTAGDFTIQLTAARMHIGAVYFDEAPPGTGFDGPVCIASGHLRGAGARARRRRPALDGAAGVLGLRQRHGRHRAELADLAHRRRRERGQLHAHRPARRGRPRDASGKAVSFGAVVTINAVNRSKGSSDPVAARAQPPLQGAHRPDRRPRPHVLPGRHALRDGRPARLVQAAVAAHRLLAGTAADDHGSDCNPDPSVFTNPQNYALAPETPPPSTQTCGGSGQPCCTDAGIPSSASAR